MYQAVSMYLCVSSAGEEDHGTSKTFRLEGPGAWGDECAGDGGRTRVCAIARSEPGKSCIIHTLKRAFGPVLYPLVGCAAHLP